MSALQPYLSAHDTYHRDGTSHISWGGMLDFHLQHGVVISRPDFFIVARPCPMDWPDHLHPDLVAMDTRPLRFPDWHVWMAAGSLRSLLMLADDHGAENVSFQRRTSRLFRRRLSDIATCSIRAGIRAGHAARHGFEQSTAIRAASTASGIVEQLGHRPGGA